MSQLPNRHKRNHFVDALERASSSANPVSNCRIRLSTASNTSLKIDNKTPTNSTWLYRDDNNNEKNKNNNSNASRSVKKDVSASKYPVSSSAPARVPLSASQKNNKSSPATDSTRVSNPKARRTMPQKQIQALRHKPPVRDQTPKKKNHRSSTGRISKPAPADTYEERRRKRESQIQALMERQVSEMKAQMPHLEERVRKQRQRVLYDMEPQRPQIEEQLREARLWLRQELEQQRKEREAQRPQIEAELRKAGLWLQRELEEQRREREAQRPHIEEQLRQSRLQIQRELQEHQKEREAQRPQIEEQLRQSGLWLQRELHARRAENRWTFY
ncbi:MAG: hypothetical protein Q9191_003971 [Dirinaria sp. TL-2023a]